MRHLLPAAILLISFLATGQNNKETELAFEIINSLEKAVTIQNLVANHTTINEQLKDIRHWSQSGSLSEGTYSELQTSYTNYVQYMNIIIEDLGDQLRSIRAKRDLKGSRMKKLMNQFESTGVKELQVARGIYSYEFSPAFERAALEADGKTGIIPAIIAIFNVGKTVFNSIKELLKKDVWDTNVEDELITFAIDLAVTKLENKLKYPAWEEVIPSFSGFTAQQSYTVQDDNSTRLNANVLPTQHGWELSEASVALSEFGSDRIIPLIAVSKNIVVGSEDRLPQDIPYFSTETPLQNGDRFWVKLKGYQYASFFYFDDESKTWQDPYGKSIIVGSTFNTWDGEARYLPSKNEYFEIIGESNHEQFLILISNSRLSEDQRNAIIGSSEGGNNILDRILVLQIPIQSPWQLEDIPNISEGSMNYIDVHADLSSEVFIPLYIKIDKN